MATKILDIVTPGATVNGVSGIVRLVTGLAQDAISPSTTKGSDKGDTPYRLATLEIASDGADDLAVYGVGRPNPKMAGIGSWAQYAQSLHADGTTADFTTKFTYAAFSAHNWIVELNGVPLTYDATPADLTEFSVTDVGGVLQVNIGDGAPLPKGEVVVINATPLKKTLLAAAPNESVKKIVNPADYIYIETGGAMVVARAQLEFFYR
jgi:hypothetical protein